MSTFLCEHSFSARDLEFSSQTRDYILRLKTEGPWRIGGGGVGVGGGWGKRKRMEACCFKNLERKPGSP